MNPENKAQPILSSGVAPANKPPSVPKPSIWPSIPFMVIVGAWTLVMHFLLPDRNPIFDLFHKHPTPETFAYVVASLFGSHWPAAIMLLYSIYQLVRGRWQRCLVSLAFIGINLLVYGCILANKPPYKFRILQGP